MEEIMNDKWISIDEAAEYLGIKTVTLRSWIRNGKIIRQGADKDGCQENAIICIAMGEL